MFRFLTIVLALAALGDAKFIEIGGKAVGEFPNGRIVGGSIASITDFPYQLSLVLNQEHICGASVISEYWAVTAAHCTAGREAMFMYVKGGSASRFSGGSVYGIAEVINHPNFDSVGALNDISLIRVSTPFVFDSTIQPVALPAANEAVADGTYAVVSGWGTVGPGSINLANNLLQVAVPTVNQATCNLAYWGTISDGMLCAGYLAGGKDACQGDSGGPLVADGKLIGVVSWGKGCGEANYPGVYTRTASYRSWIEANTGV